jgi:hypothetical protein
MFNTNKSRKSLLKFLDFLPEDKIALGQNLVDCVVDFVPNRGVLDVEIYELGWPSCLLPLLIVRWFD